MILVIINFVFLLAGLLMLAFGIVAIVKPEYILMILGKIPGMSKIPGAFDLGGIITASAIFMIVLGGVVGAVGFFGCCGACCENRSLLIAYIVVLVVVLCAEVALIIFAAVAPEKLKNSIQDVMEKSMKEFKDDITLFSNGSFRLPINAVSLGWTFLQFGANCCGTRNYTDYSSWSHNITINGMSRYAAVPISCCAKTHDINLETASKLDSTAFTGLDACLNGSYAYMNQKDCYVSISDLILKSSTIAIGIAAGIIGVELLLIIFAAVMCCQNNKE